MARMSSDALEGLYIGLSIGIGIVGFIIVALVTNALMPTWAHVSDFANFMMVCGWGAVVVIYVTLYVFGAFMLFPTVERIVFGGNQ